MILDTIRRLYPTLTKSQRQLADFVAHSYREAAFLNASQMAERMDLNEATVIRFAQRLGFSGYPELAEAIQEIVQQELQVAPGGADSQEHPALARLWAELQNAERLFRNLSPELLQQVVEILSGADSIYVLGQGAAYPFALLLRNALHAAGHRAFHLSVDPQELASLLHDARPGDVLVGLSADDGQSDLVAGALQLARRIPVATVAIACDPLSACAQAADHALICPQPERASMPPITSFTVLIDAIAHALGAQDPAMVQQRHELLRDTRADLLLRAGDR